MKPKKLSKEQAEQEIRQIFENTPTPKEIKKAKKIAMSKNIKFGDLKKKFCKKCYTFFDSKNSQIRIKNKMKIIKCKTCNHISRYKLK